MFKSAPIRDGEAKMINCFFFKTIQSVVVSSFMLLIASPLYAAGAESRLSDVTSPYLDDDDLPSRTAPLIELGDDFLGTGNLRPGFELPTGAVWQPRFWVFGGLRSAVQVWDPGDGPQQSEWANRLDIFGNLQLTGTERVVIGMQPLQSNDGEFTGYQFQQKDRGFESFNADIRTLFFEGDLAELFPNWDVFDFSPNDIGFSVGRQSLIFQDGFLINDTVDSVGFTRNNMRFTSLPWLSNLRITALYGWNNIHRDDNTEDNNSQLVGLFTSWDTIYSTIDADLMYVYSNRDSGGDLIVGGVGAVQRFGLINTTFRALGSWAPNHKSRQADNGGLFFAEVSWTPEHTFNLAYVNAFIGVNDFRSAARDATTGGPLGRTGILFAARGLGNFPAPLGNRADRAYGAAAGYQMFFDNLRRQLIVEVGGRADESQTDFDGVGIAARLQQALGDRYIIQFDGFGTLRSDSKAGFGMRTEFIVKF